MSETLLNEIRAARPEAPRALRERVRALSVREPVREPFLDRVRFALLTRTWGWRRLVLVAPATVVVALVAGGRDRPHAWRRRQPRRRAGGDRRPAGDGELRTPSALRRRCRRPAQAAPSAKDANTRRRARGSNARSRRSPGSSSASRPS